MRIKSLTDNTLFNAVIGRARPDELPVMDRGLYTDYSHFIQGPDTPIIQPQNITFTAQIDTVINRDQLRHALCNPERISPWTVGGVTFTNVNGTTRLYNGNGSLVSVALPYDTLQDRIKLSVLWNGDPATPTTNNLGFNFNETWFAAQNVRIVEAADSVKLNCTGFCYGPISALSAFDAGTDVSR